MALPPLIRRHVLFGNPPRMSPALAPSGDRLAYLAPEGDDLNLWVGTLGARDFRPVVTDPRGIRAFAWAFDARHLLYVQDRDGDENTHLYAVDLATGRVGDLTPFPGVQARIVALSAQVPDTLLVGLNLRDTGLHDVYRAALPGGPGEHGDRLGRCGPGHASAGESAGVTGRGLELVEKNLGFARFLADQRLQIVAAVAPCPQGGAEIMTRGATGEPWRPVYRVGHADLATFALAGVSADGQLVVLSSRDARSTQLLLVHPGTGQPRLLFEDRDGYDVTGVELDPASGLPRLAFVERERRDLEVLDPALAPDLAFLRHGCRGELTPVGRDLADRKWLVLENADDAPASYHLYDRATREITFLFHHLPALAGQPLAPMEAFSFTASDGLRIHGYLTFPPGTPRHRLPTVVEVHGGPWTRDRWGFRTLPQWLANRGYLCVQVNYRGSTGYGKDFINAGDGEWGGRMLDDVITAVTVLVDKGVADSRRTAIFGASYGGYAALSAAAFRPEVFACAISFAGASDLRTFITSVPGTWNLTIDELHRRVGHPVADADFLWSRSPLSRVAAIRAPLLIGQGANDPRIRRGEAEQLVAALREHRIPHEYLLFPDEGHTLTKPANRMAFYAAVERFLARHLGGRCEPPSPLDRDLSELVSA